MTDSPIIISREMDNLSNNKDSRGCGCVRRRLHPFWKGKLQASYAVIVLVLLGGLFARI